MNHKGQMVTILGERNGLVFFFLNIHNFLQPLEFNYSRKLQTFEGVLRTEMSARKKDCAVFCTGMILPKANKENISSSRLSQSTVAFLVILDFPLRMPLLEKLAGFWPLSSDISESRYSWAKFPSFFCFSRIIFIEKCLFWFFSVSCLA